MQNKGYTLIEMIIYIAVTTILLLVILDALVSIQQTRQRAVLSNRVSQSAVTALERMSRDIRSSSEVATTTSVLGTHPGVLTLNTATTAPAEIKFFLSGGTLHVSEDGVDRGSLTRNNVFVDNLIFHRIESGSTTEAVKVEMRLITGTSTATTSEDFYITEGLRQSYE